MPIHFAKRTASSLFNSCRVALLVACAVAVAHADEINLQDNAPERYVVVSGDTLWGISGKFLKDPWRWPEVWRMNKDDIKDPHWIYPGDVIVLDKSGASPSLRLLGNKTNDGLRRAEKLVPRERASLFNQAAPSIPAAAIAPFLTKPLIVDARDFQAAPRIALSQDERLVMTTGDQAFAVGIDGKVGDSWQSYRGGKELKDPHTGELLGYEVAYTGDLILTDLADSKDQVSTLKIGRVVQEVSVGDRLVPRPRDPLTNYVPHAPKLDLRGTVLAGLNGVNDAGTFSSVVINLGERDGLELGHVLFVLKKARPVVKESPREPTRIAPQTKAANIFIYKVFPRVAYGLVLDAISPVNNGDDVRKP
jgi:hypothetical protein